jgi:uncharacterized protein (TIGR00369 family)
MAQLKMDISALDAFMAREFPQAARVATRIERLEPNHIRVRLPFHEDFLRPGGTLSGPTLMGLADRATYLLVLAMVGPVALAVTTSLNIHFLSKPEPRDLTADAHLLKLGRRLAVAEVAMRSEGNETVVAQATVTYSIPSRDPSA